MTPATFAGLDNGRVLAWAASHSDPLIRELAERWRDVLAELDAALDLAVVAERQLEALDAARRVRN